MYNENTRKYKSTCPGKTPGGTRTDIIDIIVTKSELALNTTPSVEDSLDAKYVMSSESPAQAPAAALPLLVSRSKSAAEVVAPYTSMDAYSEVWESDCDPEDCAPGQQPLVSIFCIRGTYLHLF